MIENRIGLWSTCTPLKHRLRTGKNLKGLSGDTLQRLKSTTWSTPTIGMRHHSSSSFAPTSTDSLTSAPKAALIAPLIISLNSSTVKGIVTTFFSERMGESINCGSICGGLSTCCIGGGAGVQTLEVMPPSICSCPGGGDCVGTGRSGDGM